MNVPRPLAALTAINLALLLFLLARALPAGAHEYTVLRGWPTRRRRGRG